jgi:phosphatidylglycerophosphatase A
MTRKWFMKLFATFFYVGYLPKAPGTWASLAALPLIVFMRNNLAYGVVMIGLFLLGRYVAAKMARELNHEDPKEIVIDEVVGMMFTMLLIPINIKSLLLGFFLFRLFDITKPWIIRKVERFTNGYGIMLDDMVAGVFANIILRCLIVGVKG